MAATAAEITNLRFAVLIDADNVPRDCLKSTMEEIAIYGVPTIKRIYGDWTSPNVAGWKTSLLENAVTPIQQYSYTTGKNSTDSAMIIDAMDILYSGRTDGFVLVSSDSDFTRLATRLREAGMYVIGIGERKTPMPFIVACDKFVYIEVIRERARKTANVESQRTTSTAAASTASKNTNGTNGTNGRKKKPDASQTRKAPVGKTDKTAAEPKTESRVPESVVKLIADSISDLADDDGYTDLSNLGNLIIKKQPDFDPRNFGFGKLSNMLRYIERFEVEVRTTADPHVRPIFIRDKEVG